MRAWKTRFAAAVACRSMRLSRSHWTWRRVLLDEPFHRRDHRLAVNRAGDLWLEHAQEPHALIARIPGCRRPSGGIEEMLVVSRAVSRRVDGGDHCIQALPFGPRRPRIMQNGNLEHSLVAPVGHVRSESEGQVRHRVVHVGAGAERGQQVVDRVPVDAVRVELPPAPVRSDDWGAKGR